MVNEQIELEPRYWYRALWRDPAPLPKPEPTPFDWEDLQNRLFNQVIGKAEDRFHWRWYKANLSISMSRREAHFWFIIMTQWRVEDPSESFFYTPEMFTGTPHFSDMQHVVSDSGSGYKLFIGREWIIPFTVLFSLNDLITQTKDGYYTTHLATGFRNYILPYMTRQEREALHPTIREKINLLSSPMNAWERVALPYIWAAYTGMFEEVQSIMNHWPDDFFGKKNAFHSSRQSHHRINDIILGLGSPDLIIHHTKRLQLRLYTPELIYTWLANTETRELEIIKQSILAERKDKKSYELTQALGVVKVPETATHMVEIMNSKTTASRTAQIWLNTHPALAIEGLIPMAAQRGHAGKYAQDYLRTLARNGFQDQIAAIADQKTLDKIIDNTVSVDLPEFDDETTPVWLAKATDDLLRKASRKAPLWITPSDLPPVIVGEHILNEQQVRVLILALRVSHHKNELHPYLTFLKNEANRHQLDLFVWALLENWIINGKWKSEYWAGRALALLGTDALIIKLRNRIKNDVSGEKSRWLTQGLQILEEHDSDIAILQLYQLKQDLQRYRREGQVDSHLNNIAIRRGISRTELDDITIPDCGLNADGTQILDYGRRQFQVVISPDMSPIIRDENGKIRKTLPRPGVRDDELMAKPAYEQWKVIKKQIKEVIKTQSQRMEMAMRHERRWTRENFNTYFLSHPIMRHFVQHNIWGFYDDKGTLQQSFRVAGDLTFADIHDDAVNVKAHSQRKIGLVHPLHLTLEEQQKWGDIMHDYEIIEPFAQLGREVFTLTNTQLQSDHMPNPENLQIYLLAVRNTMYKLGWKESYERNNTQYQHWFPQQNVSAVINFVWVSNNTSRFETAQRVESCFFVEGKVRKQVDKAEIPPLALTCINPVIISEVLRDLSIAK